MIRNAYLKKIEDRLSRLTDEIESLGKSVEESSADAKKRFGRRMDDLRSKLAIARDRIGDVRSAGATTWGQLKKVADDAVDDLKKGVDEAVQRFRKTGSDDR